MKKSLLYYFEVFDKIQYRFTCKMMTSSGSKEGTRDASPGGSEFFQFHAVIGKLWQKSYLYDPLEGWRPHLGEILDPPLMTYNFSCQYLECIDIEIIYFCNAQHLVCQNRVCSVINKKMLFLCHLRVKWIQNLTRMYSSGMRTTRLLTVPSMHCTGGGGVCPWGCLPMGVSAHGWGCLPWGVSAQGMSAQRSVCPGVICQGGSAQGMSAHGGCLPGLCLPSRACIPACNGAETPPPVDRQTPVKT